MSGFESIQPDPSTIGRLLPPPFAVLPDPRRLFRARAERFAALGQAGDLSPYLRFLAGLCEAQAAVADTLPPPEPIPAAQVERAREGKMPPLDRNAFRDSPGLRAVIGPFLDAMVPVPKPQPAQDALEWLRRAPEESMREMLGNVVADAIPLEAIPQHLFLSAAAQIEAARLASGLDAAKLVPVEMGVCPVCGGPPAASLVVERPGAEGARYAACAFCGTQWNEVRIKCLACGSTKGVGYKAPDEGGAEPAIKAETCDSCRSWVKILYHRHNPSLEPVADDVASLGLDLLMQGTEYRRAGFDPFLIGY
ncbi:formate dehydrogenase accessory protein FdhE [Roseomonas populi]|uniref:Protein FdhE homolog n=1 Tax=Roseomonas populi TaxID=3121582 RepID=A0ABT1X9R8_9PROT|nr:formate dehydrogenase accessory protein FdhE [Roseomonas pecuniae]MCR0984837.1 formate dehydrogenase accessory protein FdhE [Roseomonas pecuniae]